MARKKTRSLTFGVGKGSERYGAHAAEPKHRYPSGILDQCSTQADSVWTKRECRKRPWGQAVGNFLNLRQV